MVCTFSMLNIVIKIALLQETWNRIIFTLYFEVETFDSNEMRACFSIEESKSFGFPKKKVFLYSTEPSHSMSRISNVHRTSRI
jgi:hypothetical protein